MKGRKIKTLTFEFWLSNWKSLHAVFPPQLWPLENNTGPSFVPPAFVKPNLKEWEQHRDWSWKSQQDKRPSRTVSVIYSTYRPHPTAFLSKHKGKTENKNKRKKKKTQTKICPLQSFTQHTDLLSPAHQRAVGPLGKVDGTVHSRNNQSRTVLSPPCFPSCGNSNLSTYKTDRPHLSGLL